MESDNTVRNMYEKIILVNKWLHHSTVKEKNSLDIFGTINYVFGEFIRSKSIDYKQRMTKEMIKEVDRSYENNEINMTKLSPMDIDLIQEYIQSIDKPATVSGYMAIKSLEDMKTKRQY